MSSTVRQPNHLRKSVAAFSNVSEVPCNAETPVARNASQFTAFSFEFVAKPEEAAKAMSELPAAIHSGLEDFADFAGSLVMASNLEVRLITVTVFWQGSDAGRSCTQSVRRVRALLAPYLDRCLRAQNLLAHLLASQAFSNEPSSIDTHFIASDSIGQQANVCVA